MERKKVYSIKDNLHSNLHAGASPTANTGICPLPANALYIGLREQEGCAIKK